MKVVAGRRSCLIGAVSWLAAACAHVPRRSDASAAAGQSRQWQGRLALKVEGDKPQSLTASFDLQGQAQQGRLALSTPLGTQLFLARWSPVDARLILPSEERRYADMAALTEDAVGAALPVEALFDWLDGRPMAMWPSTPFDLGFEQIGWQVDTHEQAAGRLGLRRLLPAPAIVVRVILTD